MSDYEPGYDDAGVYEDAPAQSSIAAPLIRALLAAAVAFGIYALVFGDIGGGDDLVVGETEDGQTAAAAAPSAVPLPDSSSVPLQPLPDGSAAPTPGASAGEGTTTGEQFGAGVSVQVIAGAGTTQDQFADAVNVLTEAGYDVTESGISPNDYPQTTIFASPGEEGQATTLNSADARFTTVGENPGTLTTELQIHVLVGEDWPIGDVAAPTDGAITAPTDGATAAPTEG